MHELSIAINIVEIAEATAKKENCTHFDSIHLEVGKQAGVVIDALEFAMEEAVKNSVLQNAKIEYLEVDAIMECQMCKHQFLIEELFTPCPKCASFDGELIQGKELNIKKLIVNN